MLYAFLISLSIFFFPQAEENVVKTADQIYSDHLGNLYFVKDNKLIKTNKELITEYTYDQPLNGEVSSVDVSDPMRIIVFSETSNSAVFLDNKLSEITEAFLLDEAGLYDVSAICSANRGGFWAFHNETRQILHMDIYAEADVHSGSVNVFDDLPDILIEEQNSLYLGYENKGIVEFDSRAAYRNTLPLKYENRFVIRNGSIYYLFENNLYMNRFPEDVLVYESEDKEILDFTISGEFLFFIDNDGVINKQRI